MAPVSSPKRHHLEVIRRPEGGLGGTRPVVVPPGPERSSRRDLVATLQELVNALIELTDDDRAASTMPRADLPLLLNAAEAGKLLSISRTKVLDLAGRGQLPSLRIGGSVRIPRDQLLGWITDNSVSAEARWAMERSHRAHTRRTPSSE